MATFTSDEVQAAVEKLVRSTIRRPYDTLGVRRTDVSFGDVQEAVAGVFMLYPKAPFYCLLLGTKRLRELVQDEIVLIGQVKEAVGALGRRVLPVESVTSLFNAKVALEALESAVAKSAPTDITKLPQYQRFDANIASFLQTEGSKIKSGGTIVPTPEEARGVLPALMTQLKVTHELIIERVKLLAAGISDYSTVNLPTLVAKGVVTRAREVLGAHADALDALSQEERLTKIRAAILDVVTAKAVVKKFGSFSGPTDFVALSGMGSVYADDAHPALPATARSTVTNHYACYAGVNDDLSVTYDAAAPTSLSIPASQNILLLGSQTEQQVVGSPNGFLIGNGTNPTVLGGGTTPNNNRLRFKLKDALGLLSPHIYNVTLTVSADASGIVPPQNRTAAQVAADINAVIGPDLVCEPYFTPLYFQGHCNITSLGGSSAQFDVVGGIKLITAFVPGLVVSIDAGPNTGLWTVTGVPTTTRFVASRISGLPVNESNRLCSAGTELRALRIRGTNPSVQVPGEYQLEVLSDDPVATQGALTLGFTPGLVSSARPTTMAELANYLQPLTSKVTIDYVVEPYLEGGSFRTTPGNSFLVTSSKLLTTGDVVFTAGPLNTITVTVASGGLLLAGVESGDFVVLRGGTPADTGWYITSVTDTQVVATSALSGITATGVTVEFGSRLTSLARRDVISIASGPNRGDVLLSGEVSPSILDFPLLEPLGASQEAGTGVPLAMTASVGPTRLRITSKSPLLSSLLSFSSSQALMNESTVYKAQPLWFKLPALGASAGDILEYYATSYNTPSLALSISDTDGDLVYIGDAGALPDAPANWTFDAVPAPFARVRYGHMDNYTQYRTLLEAWLAGTEQQSSYFTNLNRFINPLLVSKSPTAVQIADAQRPLDALITSLSTTLTRALDSYSADKVPSVDALIRTFKEKGSDRAIDTLLRGEFSSFFGLTQEESSYGGAMQAAMREVVRNDLPVRKTNRGSSINGRLLGTAQSPDYEFDHSDAETGLKPDVPVDSGDV